MSFDAKIVHGNKDIVHRLEHALELAKKGEMVGLIICGVFEHVDGDYDSQQTIGWTGAYKSDILHPWPRLLTAVCAAKRDILNEGVRDWE